jgi:2-polyprenyl-3-methyl-5-hydroxy-6-metoxy-1,4-benzoquinol methylase
VNDGPTGASSFDRAYFDDESIYSRYADSPPTELEHWYAVLLRGLERKTGPLTRPGDLVLDAGCGFGTTAALLQQRGCRVVASDLSFYAVQRAMVETPLPYVQSDIARLPFRDARFDVTAAFEVVEHIPSPMAAIDELVRVTKPGGLVLLSTPNPLSGLLPGYDPWSDQTHLSVLSPRRWSQALATAGLEAVHAYTMFTPPMLWRRFPSRIRSVQLPLVGPICVLTGRRPIA